MRITFKPIFKGAPKDLDKLRVLTTALNIKEAFNGKRKEITFEVENIDTIFEIQELINLEELRIERKRFAGEERS